MAAILLKRGLITNIDSVSLEYGEAALAYSEDKTKVSLYVGDGNGGKVLVTADVAAALTEAKTYTDTAISNLVNGAPEAMDTLKELSDAISSNSDIMTALQSAIDDKVDKVDGMGLSTNDYTTDEKTKLAGIAEGATKVEASDTNGNILIDGVETVVYTASETIDGGTF